MALLVAAGAIALAMFYYDQDIANATFLSAKQVRQLSLGVLAVAGAIRFGFWFWKI